MFNWENRIITITRINDDYTESILHKDIKAKIVNIDESNFNSKISEVQPKESKSVCVDVQYNNIKIWDVIEYIDEAWDVRLKVTKRPELVEFPWEEFFDLVCEYL